MQSFRHVNVRLNGFRRKYSTGNFRSQDKSNLILECTLAVYRVKRSFDVVIKRVGDKGFVNLGPCVFIFETSSQQVKEKRSWSVGR